MPCIQDFLKTFNAESWYLEPPTHTLHTIQKIQVHSALIKPGDIFIALPGSQHHGHKFLVDAQKRGAFIALVEKIHPSIHMPQLCVPSTYETFVSLAKWITKDLPVKIGITGSMGKTTTVFWLHTLLKPLTHVYWAETNYNNHVGLPLSMVNTPTNTTIGLYEMGMSAPQEIQYLTKILHPHVALITNIGEAHMMNFDSTKDVALAKSEIFEGLGKNGIPLLPSFSAEFNILLHALKNVDKHVNSSKHLLTFGYKDTDTIQIHPKDNHDTGNNDADIHITNNITHTDVHLPCHQWPSYEIEMLAGVLCAIQGVQSYQEVQSYQGVQSYQEHSQSQHSLQINQEALNQSIHALTSFHHRGQIIHKNIQQNSVIIIDDTYNASLPSMKAALVKLVQTPPQTPSQTPPQTSSQTSSIMQDVSAILPIKTDPLASPIKRLAILGGMAEMGNKSQKYHQDIASLCNNLQINHILIIGKEWKPKYFKNLYQHYPTYTDAILYGILTLLDKNTIILVKGAHCYHLERLVQELIHEGEKGT